jgi:hypothetical protein
MAYLPECRLAAQSADGTDFDLADILAYAVDCAKTLKAVAKAI